MIKADRAAESVPAPAAASPALESDPPQATTTRSDLSPHVVEPVLSPESNLLSFPGQIEKKRGRKKKDPSDTYRVSVEKVSKNTYAVRIRWRREDGSDDPGVVVARLTDDIVKNIHRSKKLYEQFKAQTLISWQSRTVRESDIDRTDSVSSV